ncbi:hypothetical protein JW916_14580, partial [Candidatus Sumerlaeota bacterium]|nr:hypothetical protein [Candidatus Sumerlaeota bacterium]
PLPVDITGDSRSLWIRFWGAGHLENLRSAGYLASNMEPGNRVDVRITGLNGRFYPGWLYYGETHATEYLQVKVKAREATGYCSHVGLRDVIHIEFRQVDREIIVVLELGRHASCVDQR